MKKSDFWKYVWISLSTRKPPPNQEKFVLIWNYKWKEPMVMNALVARCGADTLEKEELISTDRIFSHWCFIEPPILLHRQTHD
jgi:hypothetical protein